MGKLTNLSLALVAALFFTGCLDDLNIFKKDKAQAAASAMPPAQVDVVVAKKGDYPMSFNYPARIQSEQDVIIKPKVSGTLLKQNFKAGDTVKEGQVLFVIDPEKYQATYESSKASIAQAEANLKNAKNEMERVKKLFAQKALSQKDYDSALATYESADATLKSAIASTKSAKLDLGYTNVTAPFSGMVGENLVDVGAYIAAGSTELVRLTKIDPIDVRFYISDIDELNRAKNIDQNSWEQINKEAILTVDGQNFEGKVKFIDSTVDVNSGGVLAKAEFENKDGKLLPGVFARISMNGFVQKDSFAIPQVAILQDTVSPYVYLVKDGKVVKKSIKIIYQTVTEAYVKEGLEEGDVIILNNFKKIGPGSSVQPDTQGKENK
ncbi:MULTISPECIES: efflux RND transporter periplasmic adaptor subunit [Campylobacter]|uniref:Multidrug efflux system CmeABC, periplasmic fusion protein CmeA n=1 Tax=Campylobacter curvus (strain 525.92) TaxID=360105 RepID=A7GW89_CAMC5|nr:MULTISPECIES: efflux RND transporter periplasmic adaptor subunit [Campylobacter]EAT99488.2 multidrug efflux system CmeABC, periplasmic fusion protein CmeA [Campylobacter curvus 525.92]EJP75826.1 efflux transporter, RND family, MFP subunit [Campylobacter sp. FOBRC14]